jgi:hypothetical protein
MVASAPSTAAFTAGAARLSSKNENVRADIFSFLHIACIGVSNGLMELKISETSSFWPTVVYEVRVLIVLYSLCFFEN